MMEKRLGYIANSILYKKGGRYYYSTGEFIYLIRFAELFDVIEVHLRIESLNDHDATALAGLKELVLPNAEYYDTRSGSKRALRERASQWTMGFFMAPNWLALLGRRLSRKYGFPYVLCLRGEWSGVLANSLASRRIPVAPLKYPLAVLSNHYERILLRDAAIRLTNLFSLWSKYPEFAASFIESLTMTIEPERFSRREDTCLNKTIRLVSVGVLSKRKGYDITLAALRQLRDSGIDIVFDVVGDGPEKSNLQRLAEEYKLNDSVYFHGVLVGDAKWDVLGAADVFMHNSYSEGFPRVVYEAYAKSLPVIITAVGGVAFRLKNDENATIIPPGSVEETASALRRMVSDADYRQSLIANGHRFAKELFAVHPVEQALQAVRQEWPSLVKN